jgi:pyruvate dehydrogenase E2 component (dihydrolipoamide acetyltransferase)
MSIKIKLPELGDGIDSGDVLEVLVSEGDVIEKEQGVVELETDKATVEVPSSHAGTVTKVHISVGETIKIGATLISVEAWQAEEAAPARPQTTAPAAKAPPADKPAESPPPTPPQEARSASPVEPPAPSPTHKPVTEAVTASAASSHAEGVIAAGPAVRRFAREVGVDLSLLTGSGAGGRITREDVLAVVRTASKGHQAADTEKPTESDDWGPIRTEKMSKIRRTIASKMLESWTTVPRVTNYDDADVTELEHIRQISKADYAEKGIKLTTMPFVIKAIAMALKEHPVINATLDLDQGQVVYKQYVNIGVAVDTERGLVVPSLRNADQLSISDIARELATIAKSVREGTFKLSDLRGSTFTISNLGSIGGTYSTPIINVPEVAILLIGRSRQLPVVVADEIKVRLMMPLSLSYDHRLVDGAAAARFLNEVIGYLGAPSRLLLAP